MTDANPSPCCQTTVTAITAHVKQDSEKSVVSLMVDLNEESPPMYQLCNTTSDSEQKLRQARVPDLPLHAEAQSMGAFPRIDRVEYKKPSADTLSVCHRVYAALEYLQHHKACRGEHVGDLLLQVVLGAWLSNLHNTSGW